MRLENWTERTKIYIDASALPSAIHHLTSQYCPSHTDWQAEGLISNICIHLLISVSFERTKKFNIWSHDHQQSASELMRRPKIIVPQL